MLAASVLLGEEFDITRIRYSHGVMALILLVAVCWLLLTAISVGPGEVTFPRLPTNDLAYWGYAIPICIGFLVGPWLDLQQWQRAIQMHRERISIAAAYWAGSTQFFVMLLFHGCLALWALNWGAGSYLRTGIANYVYGHELLLRLFYERFSAWTFAAYVVWLVICILSTLDSGYIALRWFLQANASASKSPIFSLIPESVIASPIPVFIFAGLFALFASVVKLELEYFMIFYATFFVGYSALAITRCYMNTPANVIPQVKMFCIGCLAVVIFAYGYFLRLPILQILGSLLPLALVIWLIFKPGSSQEFIGDSRALSPVSEIPNAAGGGTGLGVVRHHAQGGDSTTRGSSRQRARRHRRSIFRTGRRIQHPRTRSLGALRGQMVRAFIYRHLCRYKFGRQRLLRNVRHVGW